MLHVTLFPILNVLQFYVSTFRSILFMPCPKWLLFVVLDFVLSWFVVQVFLKYFETVQISLVVTAVTLVFYIPHVVCF